jgi:CRISPR-associated protein Csm1
MHTFQALRAAWTGEPTAASAGFRAWPSIGVAVEGDFSGIQRFVSRPVPGASGAGRRLRSRSFRVLALTRLVAASVEKRFEDAESRLFYAAGGRFLVRLNPCTGWRDRLVSLQRDLDTDLLDAYHGELAFHLAGAEFTDGRIPISALGDAMRTRKEMPFGYALRNGSGWATDRFTFGATDHGKCDGCGCTARLSHDSGDSEKLCQTCIDDRELGKRLLSAERISLTRSQQGLVSLLGERWDISPDGPLTIPAVCYAPVENGELATFEQIASRAPGRPYLAYLRIDADRIGQQFRALAGDPQRTWGLSGLLDGAFSTAVPNLIRASYPSIYPVYTGGDDLFVIGPWNEILDFAAAWRSKFREISGDRLTFSAGVALAKPRQHILTKSEEAAYALDECAKIPRDSIHALGSTIPWSRFDEVLKCARQLAEFHAAGQIRGALLHDIIELHGRWRKGDARWHSLLFYQVERNMGGDAKTFVRRALLSPGDLWKHADFVVRYAMLRSGEREKD